MQGLSCKIKPGGIVSDGFRLLGLRGDNVKVQLVKVQLKRSMRLLEGDKFRRLTKKKVQIYYILSTYYFLYYSNISVFSLESINI
uniref:Uncharacterized protein n=1 Tax=Lepeophtheirus salmonis TaxID=72036 RepID=A0A0K2UVS2_LEPSM